MEFTVYVCKRKVHNAETSDFHVAISFLFKNLINAVRIASSPNTQCRQCALIPLLHLVNGKRGD